MKQLAANMRAFDLPTVGLYDALWASRLGGFYARVAHRVTRTCRAGELLEVSCGPGRLAAQLARLAPGLAITGLDLTPGMVARARDRAVRQGLDARMRFVVGDATRLPFATARFDGVVSTLSLHHWPDPLRAVDEIHRVLKPEGEAWIYDLACWLCPPIHDGRELTQLAAASSFAESRVAVVRWPGRLPTFRSLHLRRGADLA
jgi:SAM-dependent methyltransferase